MTMIGPIPTMGIMTVTDAELFTATGKVLYHTDNWRVYMAVQLRVDARKLRRWQFGQEAIPERIWAEVHELVKQKGRKIDELDQRIQQRPKA